MIERRGSICLSCYLSFLSFSLSLSLSLSFSLSIYLSIYLSLYLSIYIWRDRRPASGKLIRTTSAVGASTRAE